MSVKKEKPSSGVSGDTLQRRLRQQELMAAISQSFISSGELSTLFKNALLMTGNVMNVDRTVLARLDQETNTLKFEYEWSNHAHPVPAAAALPFGPGELFYDTFITRGDVYLASSDVEEDSVLAARYRPLGVKAVVNVPVMVYSRFWGVFCIEERQSRRVWDESDIQTLRLIANIIAGLVIRNETEQALIAAKEQAEQFSMAKGNFLSRMSHEMRTPMNAIIGMTAIAQASQDPKKREYCLSKIQEASVHLLGVINDILDMSKIEAGKFELSYTEFDFERMLQRVTNVMNFKFEEKRQNFVVRLGGNVPSGIIGDEQRLAQVLTNLLSNAGKFTPEGGSIALSVNKTAERYTPGKNKLCTLHIEVIDTGIGIAPEHQKRLFSLFEQADGSIARKYGGTGLGLSISKSIVELMGGEIWVQSEEGKGATFAFEITVEQGKPPVRNTADFKWDWKQIRILVADDSPEVLDYFKEFADSVGLNCTTASSGGEAYRIFETAQGKSVGKPPFDLVFADWRMPGMNGLELTQLLKQQFGDNVVVIMISASEWSTIEAEAQKAGVNGFIPKPLFASVLMDCINSHLVPPPAAAKPEQIAPSEIAVFNGFTLLLAEDVEINREIVLTLLEDTGIAIETAGNGREVLQKFREAPSKYHIILMDIHMPEMDGFEATRQIRALEAPEARTIPIVAMTANVFREDIEKCLTAGMNDHLGKPIDIEDLMKKLRQYLFNT
ncbi:MAG: response regulator [Spirochaetaceae bacterium]|nr:response regulator [Spirochaetaceae bacterium]